VRNRGSNGESEGEVGRSEEQKGTRYQNRLQGTPRLGCKERSNNNVAGVTVQCNRLHPYPVPNATPPDGYPLSTLPLSLHHLPISSGRFGVGARQPQRSSLPSAQWGGSTPSSPLSGGCGFGRIRSAGTVSPLSISACDHLPTIASGFRS
jgi:hypothetical protein